MSHSLINTSPTVIKEGKEELNFVVKMFISVRFSFFTNSKCRPSCRPMFLGFQSCGLFDKIRAKMDEGTFLGESVVHLCNIT